ITNQPYDGSPAGWYEAIGPNTGKFTVNPVFSGESIYQKKTSGVYTFALYIMDSTGALMDTAVFSTKTHQYTEFGESPLRMKQFSESATDTSGDGLYDVISVKMNIEASIAGSYMVQSALSKDGNIIASSGMPFNLAAGNNQITNLMGAKYVSAAGKDGPYTLSIQLCGADGTQLTSDEMQTAAYKASQFIPPAATLSAGTGETTFDTNENGLFDTLQVELMLNTIAGNNYTVTAYLVSQKDSFIAVSSSSLQAEPGYNSVLLHFAGTDISRSKADGPYKIGYAVIKDTMMDPVYSGFDLYTTEAYSAAEFEQPKGKIIQATGIYAEKLIDSDSDGLTDSLEIGVEVVPADSGYVVAMGQLANSEGESMCWSSAQKFMKGGEKAYINLMFDGGKIYGNLSDGPYELKNLLVYHSGLPQESINISSAYKTSDYKYISFEKAGVVTGTVKDKNGNPVAGALLSLQDSTFDYSEPTGKYHLVTHRNGQLLMKIKGPDTLKLEWSITRGTSTIKGDSLIVSVSKDTIQSVDFKAPVVITGIEDKTALTPLPYYKLMQNYPNPFNPSTTIRYNIPQADKVTLVIFDMLGKRLMTLVDEYQPAGMHEKKFRADMLSSGIYYYQIRSGSFIETRKMLLVK
ncbi:MAG: T9SS type A sorting domain-containing protein, partial [Ignavibacteriales bacterium]